MAEKELRKMNRTELIEIIYALQQNGLTLQQENEELHRQLEDKTIRIENAGSIAEAALSLNRIFEDAEAAAQQYLDSVRTACETDMRQNEEASALQNEEASASQNEEASASQNEEASAPQNEEASAPQNEEVSAPQNEEVSERQIEESLAAKEIDASTLDEDFFTAHKDANRIREAQQESTRLLQEAQQECTHRLEEARKESTQLLEEARKESAQLQEKAQQESTQLLEEARKESAQLLEEAQQKCAQMQSDTRQECDRLREQALRQAREKIDTVNREIRLLLKKYPALAEYMKSEFTASDKK